MLFCKQKKEEMLENLGATDIQLIPHFALRLSSKYHANGSVVEAGVALLANTLLHVWSLSKKGKTIPPRQLDLVPERNTMLTWGGCDVTGCFIAM